MSASLSALSVFMCDRKQSCSGHHVKFTSYVDMRYILNIYTFLWYSGIGIAYWQQLCQICGHFESLHLPRGVRVLAPCFPLLARLTRVFLFDSLKKLPKTLLTTHHALSPHPHVIICIIHLITVVSYYNASAISSFNSRIIFIFI